ncbi:MAG: serine hydrolase domain-containing protein [Gammaproteobacteria bacterium]
MRRLVVFNLLFLFVAAAPLKQLNAAIIARTMPTNCQEIFSKNNKFNQNFLKFLEKWQIPGASIAVMQNNKIILSCGYGWANLEERQPMQPGSLFRLGSVSKTITAIAILKLVEQNKINLDDKVFILLSDLTPINKLQPNPEIYKITVRDLLQMSSGWYSDRPEDYDPMFGPWSDTMLRALSYQIPPSCEMAARMMMGMPLEFSPGTKFSYSNLNYCLLGLIINKVTQQNGALGYELYIKHTLLSPLGINDMRLGSTNFANSAVHEVKYYADDKNVFNDIDRTLDGFPYSKTDILNKNYADGGWVASAPDLVKILQALYDNKLLASKTKKIMIEKPAYWNKKLGYPAMGWDEVYITKEKNFISKIGSFTGTNAFILQNKEGISYAALFNTKPAHEDQFIKELKEKLTEINIER